MLILFKARTFLSLGHAIVNKVKVITNVVFQLLQRSPEFLHQRDPKIFLGDNVFQQWEFQSCATSRSLRLDAVRHKTIFAFIIKELKLMKAYL